MSQISRRVALSVIALLVATSAAVAQPAPPSGMLLGVYAFENFRGLRITDTMRGYSAEGRLFPGDVLLQATTDGSNVFSIRTMREFEFAKDQIGPNTPAAIEVFRPGVGRIYFWVEFTPVGGVGEQPGDPRGLPALAPVRAQFRTEAERPGARALFNGGGLEEGGLNPGGNGGFNNGGRPSNDDFRDNGRFNGNPGLVPQRPMGGQGNPGDLFNR